MNFDSKEELYFSYWLEELEEAGYIGSWGQAKTYPLGEKIINKYEEQLKTKSKEKEQVILNGCEYTPDFEIDWNISALDIFYNAIELQYNRKINTSLFISDITGDSIVEIKPSYDQNNMTRLNAINRKWMFQKHNIFVNLVKVPDIFKDTFTPQKFLMTDSGKQQRIIHFQTKTLDEYIKERTKTNS